jgi:hypothetical protein
MTDFNAAQDSGIRFLGVLSNGENPFPEGTRVMHDMTVLSDTLVQGL